MPQQKTLTCTAVEYEDILRETKRDNSVISFLSVVTRDKPRLHFFLLFFFFLFLVMVIMGNNVIAFFALSFSQTLFIVKCETVKLLLIILFFFM